jgi:GT2 family glycosyltransferase
VESPPLDTDAPDADDLPEQDDGELDDVEGPVEVPLVQGVLVTCDPGPNLPAVLASIAAQDYPALALLVVDTGSREVDAVEDAVRAGLPGARFVRRTDRNLSAAANLPIEEGTSAPFLLLLHDDVRLDPDAVRQLVEEMFRSNAGIAGAKLVDWDEPDRLLQVGMSVDKTGWPASLVDRGELDQEQHDAVRDVFYAPGACTLIRTDLLRALGGFDVEMAVVGQDLDLCWRAHVAGARVLVAPAARVAHREALAERPPPGGRGRLARRHRVRTLLTCYSGAHLVRVVPQAVLLATVETLFALLTGHVHEAKGIVGAWTWNVRRAGELRRRRRALAALRGVPDKEIRALQVHGSARLSSYLRGALVGRDERFRGVGGVGRTMAMRLREPAAQRAVLLWIAVVIVVLLGSRHLLTRPIPAFGELVAFPESSGAALREYRSAAPLSGVGSDVPSSTLLAALGVSGLAVLGQLALLRTLIVVGSLFVGLLGSWRLAAPTRSWRVQMAALVAYLAVPVGYNAIGEGHLTGMVAYALAPYLVAVIARVAGGAPLAPTSTRHGLAALAALLTVGGLVDPLFLLLGPVVALAVAGGSVLVGQPAGSARLIGVSFGAALLGGLVLLPWSLTWGSSWEAFARPRHSPVDPAGADDILRFATGGLGAGPLGYAILVAAALPLLIGRDWRLVWAVRGWIVALVAWALALAGAQGWLPVALPPLEMILAPGAVGLALSVAMGVAAFEIDLREFHFGWRQLVSLVAGAALVAATLPVLGDVVVDGAWGAPSRSLDRTIAFIDDEWAAEPFRVVWVGDPEVLPLTGWSFDDAVTYQATSTGSPTVRDLFPADPGGTNAPLRDALDQAAEGSTVRLGAALAPLGVRYLVLPVRRSSTGTDELVPDSPLIEALPEQLDLSAVEVSSAVRVWENAAWVPGAEPVDTAVDPTTARTIWLIVGLGAWLAVTAFAIRTRTESRS